MLPTNREISSDKEGGRQLTSEPVWTIQKGSTCPWRGRNVLQDSVWHAPKPEQITFWRSIPVTTRGLLQSLKKKKKEKFSFKETWSQAHILFLPLGAEVRALDKAHFSSLYRTVDWIWSATACSQGFARSVSHTGKKYFQDNALPLWPQLVSDLSQQPD